MDKQIPSLCSKILSYLGFGLFGVVVGYITGNSVTSVSSIVVASLLGFMGSIVSAIIGSKDDQSLDRNFTRLGKVFFCFAIGLALGILVGAHLKGTERVVNFIIPSISHDMSH